MTGTPPQVIIPLRVAWGLAVVVSAVCLVVGWWRPPAISNDLAAGWQVWTSMESGAPFNSVWMPATSDLARDVPTFQAWWSPGQYLVPALFTRMGLSLGQAVLLAGVLANLAGLAGWLRLWRAWSLPENACAVAATIVVLGRAWGTVAGTANLGDVLLFAIVPWAALLAWRGRALRPGEWLGLFIVLNIGMTLKLAFLAAAAAMLAGGVVETMRAAETARARVRWIGWALKAGVLWLALKLTWDWFYLSRGAAIAAGHGWEFAGIAETLLPWGGPLLAVLSAGSLLSRLFLHPARSVFEDETGLWPAYLLAAGLSMAIVRRIWRADGLPVYRRQLAIWLVVYGVIFTALYATGAPVSVEERHFQAAGLVLLPGAVWAIMEIRATALRRICWLGVTGCCLYGSAALWVHAWQRRNGVQSRLGFTHSELTRGALAELRRLDGEPGNRTLFFTHAAEIALEVRHGRTMGVPLDYWPESLVRRFVYEGRADRLVLVFPKRHLESGRVEWLKAGLHGYRDWDVREVDGFVFIAGH